MSQDEHQKIAEFYNNIYYRELGNAHMCPSRHAVQLAQRLGISPGLKLLDVACGSGNWLAAAAQRGADVSGIDISERAIAVCRRRLPDGHFYTGVAEQLPFDNHTFDLVSCLGSLEHFLDQPKALKEMRRVAKPDARLLILVPNSDFLTYRLGLYRGTQQQAVRETIRSLNEWQALLADAGLEVMQRWKDLHILSRNWIIRPPYYFIPLRLIQALSLTVWPLSWQYQVYHLCQLRSS
ncbi:class I SAM-dependent methyltransferase [Thiorhodospira sibirica]|uniref:class I SAM-dependent methyltransferase n=1 Tax=Thiorhodospira sibirica TaxID=154347 RepID=UPI00022C1727|nr:methyltransferase domain-containing protein [Thiorhodospira sibirica]